MARGLNNNNPGNIRKSSTHYDGEKDTSSDIAFKQFISMAYGYRAMLMTLKSYMIHYGLNTIEGMIHRWAPPSENATDSYVATVSKRSGIGKDDIVDWSDRGSMGKIISAMSFVENGIPAVQSDIEAGLDLFYSEAAK